MRTNKQGKIQAEDGTWVNKNFYDKKPRPSLRSQIGIPKPKSKIGKAASKMLGY